MLEEQLRKICPASVRAIALQSRRQEDLTVDILTADAGIIWVFPDTDFGRKAFACREGSVILHSLAGHLEHQDRIRDRANAPSWGRDLAATSCNSSGESPRCFLL